MTDTGSIEKFRGSIPTNYFRYIQGVVLMYDLTKPPSLDDLEDWTADAHYKTASDTTITYALIGTRLDKIEDESCLRRASIFGLRHEIPEELQFKVSAVNESRESLLEAFRTLARSIYTTKMNRDPEDLHESGRSLVVSTEHTDSEKRCFKC